MVIDAIITKQDIQHILDFMNENEMDKIQLFWKEEHDKYELVKPLSRMRKEGE